MCEPQLVFVSLVIGWKSGVTTLNQSLSQVMQNQSNLLITFNTQLKIPSLLTIMTNKRDDPNTYSNKIIIDLNYVIVVF